MATRKTSKGGTRKKAPQSQPTEPQRQPMELKTSPLIVIIGAFNDKIFRDPVWCSNFLFDDTKPEDIKININLNITDDNVNTSVAGKGIELNLAGTRLQIKPQKMDDEGFSAAQKIVTRMSTCIPHTPIGAFGINFTFQTTIEQVNGSIIAGVSPKDEWKIIGTKMVKDTECGEMSCECKLDTATKLLTATFNFHNKMEGKALLNIKNMLLNGLIANALSACHPLAEKMRRAFEGEEE